MKKIIYSALLILSIHTANAQSPISVSPLFTQEYCPNTNTTFTVTVSGYQPTVFGWTNGPIVVSANYPPTNVSASTTFTFVGTFQDLNNAQTFGVQYKREGKTDTTEYITFKKIKSLRIANTFSQVIPSPSSIIAQRCQSQNFNISFANVKYGNPYETPPIGYGSVSNYQYLLPANWKLGTVISDGVTWINGTNSATVTSDFCNGDGTNIKIRPINTSCGIGLAVGQEAYIPITRPAPDLFITATQNYICSGSSLVTINNLPTGASITWATSNPAQLAVTGGTNANTATVTRVNTGNLSVNVIATVTHCCFTYTRTFPIALGTGANEIFFTSGDAVCENGKPYFYGCMREVPRALTCNWYVKDLSKPTSGWIFKDNSLNCTDFPLNGVGIGPYAIRATVTTNCGTLQSADDQLILTRPNCARTSSLRYSISPNPVNNIIIITQSDEQDSKDLSSKSAINSTVIINIIDIQTNTRIISKRFTDNLKTRKLDISNLKSGVYILQIIEGEKIEQIKFIK